MHIACNTTRCAPPCSEADDVHFRRVRRLESRLEEGKELEFLAGCLGMFFPKSIEALGCMGELCGGKRHIPVVMNERRVYERTGKFGPPHAVYGHLELWWAGEHWWLGPATACGQPLGLLRLRTQGPSPEGVDWAYYCNSQQKWKAAGVKSCKVYEGGSEEATENTDEKPKEEGSAGGAASAVDHDDRRADASEAGETEREMTEEEARIWWREEMCAVKELLGAHSLD